MPSSSNPGRFGIVASRFNREIIDQLLKGALNRFKTHRVSSTRIDLCWVPGAFELPAAALRMARTKRYQAIVALGCILAGETPQFAYLSEAAYQGLILAGVLSGVPITCGVITAKQWKQALQRARENGLNRGGEAAEAAWEMSRLFKRFSKSHAR